MVTRHDPAKDVFEDELSDCIVDRIRRVIVKLDDRGDSDGVSWAFAVHRADGKVPGRVFPLPCSGRHENTIRINQLIISCCKRVLCNNATNIEK